jgi:NADPH2:quinone reductase
VPRELACMADYGRLVFISALGGELGQFNIRELMRRRLRITGSTLRSRSVEYKGAIVRTLVERVWPHIEAGRIRPVVERRFALREAAAAQALMEAGQHTGKILLVT